MKLKKIVAPVKLWKRVVAYIIDIIIVNIIIVYPFMNFLGNFENDSFLREFSYEILSVFFIISILIILYWAFLEYFLRQSVGKALMNIHIRSTEKQELKFWQCFVRNLSKISTLLLLIDSLGIIFKGDYQRFLEKLSKTEVVDGEL